jgi:hypothetical protein
MKGKSPDPVASPASQSLKELQCDGWKLDILPGNKGSMTSPEGVVMDMNYDHTTGISKILANPKVPFSHNASEKLYETLRNFRPYKNP